jgi:prolyl-tRNA synthetase
MVKKEETKQEKDQKGIVADKESSKSIHQSAKDQKGIVADKDDFSEWFAELMIKADLADYTDVSGCIVFKPNSYEIWQKIQQLVDERFRKIGVRNSYFPLFIPEKYLNKEKEHVEGFSPEVAWVEKAGDSKLNERLAVRPTSETIMYPSYSKWIRSWRDLPLRYNQWNNVVRWEFKHPVPFFRTREFLWNELHSVCATEKESIAEGKMVMDAYNDVTENYMGLYGVYGRKTDREKFAGGVFSEKVHYIMANGKVLEGCPFHHDGQNFAKAYDIKFLDENGKEQYGWQNTYAISTRMLGVMFAIHSDEKGLIIPPRMALNSVVVIPILFENTKEKVLKVCDDLAKELKSFNAFVDKRENVSVGFKFNEWELKGMPIRIEIGPKDLEKDQVVVVRRDNFKKEFVKISEVKKFVERSLDEIQSGLFEKSKKLFLSKLADANSVEELKKVIEDKKVGLVPLCKQESCEEMLKAETKGAKALWIDNKKVKSEKCIVCGKKADYFVYAGKSY